MKMQIEENKQNSNVFCTKFSGNKFEIIKKNETLTISGKFITKECMSISK